MKWSLICASQVVTFGVATPARSGLPRCVVLPYQRAVPDVGSHRAGFSLLGGVASGFTRCVTAQVQFQLCLLLHGLREVAVLLASSTLFRPSADRSTYYALC
jgi:hypothetical protein